MWIYKAHNVSKQAESVDFRMQLHYLLVVVVVSDVKVYWLQYQSLACSAQFIQHSTVTESGTQCTVHSAQHSNAVIFAVN